MLSIIVNIMDEQLFLTFIIRYKRVDVMYRICCHGRCVSDYTQTNVVKSVMDVLSVYSATTGFSS